jgi:hypothetical protein
VGRGSGRRSQRAGLELREVWAAVPEARRRVAVYWLAVMARRSRRSNTRHRRRERRGNDSLIWPHLGLLCSLEVAPPPTDRVLRSVVADTTGRRRRDAIEGGAVREYPPRQPAGGYGIGALARKHHVHRRTVRQALLSAVPPQRKPVERPSPVLEAWKPLIRAWVTADEALPKKQRHTGRRVWERLVAEYGAEVGESTVRKYVARLRRELAAAWPA